MKSNSCLNFGSYLSRVCAAWILLFLGGCQCNNATTPASVGSGVVQQLPEGIPASVEGGDAKKMIERGRVIYNTNCLACHNSNPKLPGTIGPEVAGSSLELLDARIVKATYPEGYKPRRTSTAMPALPYLKNDIPALHAYLNNL